MRLWDEEYSCAPYVEPKVGCHYIMQCYRITRPVYVLGVFSELIVVRYQEPNADGHIEEAVTRRNASFFVIPSCSKMATTTDADTPVE